MQLTITNLYGHYNYEINLMPGGITILTGPNGFGKSTILRCIEAFGNSDINFFAELPFDNIKYTSDTGESINLTKQGNVLTINEHNYEFREVITKNRLRNSLRETKIKVSPLFDNKDVIDQELQSMAQAAGTIKLIREQRLFKEIKGYRNIEGTFRPEVRYENMVDYVSHLLSIKMMRIANQYSEVSTRLDSSFPHRLLKDNSEKPLTEADFSLLYHEMKKKLSVLAENGILKLEDYGDLIFKPEDAKVLKIFFKDFDEKYAVYASFVERFILFKGIIERRFKFKKVRLSETRELIIYDDMTMKEIPLKSLSSGEQEIIILFYELIFNTKEETLILIDEPEISLHVAWQLMFIEDLKRIVKLNQLRTLIATHSPEIINGNSDMQIDLGELYQNGFNQDCNK